MLALPAEKKWQIYCNRKKVRSRENVGKKARRRKKKKNDDDAFFMLRKTSLRRHRRRSSGLFSIRTVFFHALAITRKLYSVLPGCLWRSSRFTPSPFYNLFLSRQKWTKKKKERERVKIQKKTSFSICLPKNVFSIVFIVGKHFKSRCQQRSCVVFYFLLWHWLSFFFSLALLAIVLWPAKMDSLPRSKRKSEWWHASGSFFYFKNEKKILLISKKLLLFCHLKTTWKMCFCVFNLFWLIHKFFLYL